MFIHEFKWLAIVIPITFFPALSLIPKTSLAQSEATNSAPPPTPSTFLNNTDLPPVEQPLVPEGVFALRLAEALNQDAGSDEAKAEELLSHLGIEPKNGWISEYPMTPAVLGEIDKGISAAGDQGSIAFTKEQALKIVNELKTSLGLAFDTNPNPPATLISHPGNLKIYRYTDDKGAMHYTDNYDSIPKEYRQNAKIVSQATPHNYSSGTGGGMAPAPGDQVMAAPPPEIINNYYYDQGPPVITYYSPPEPYYYLYTWVPYPFWATGFYFPGFFVLNDFHRRVFYGRHPHDIAHHAGPSHDNWSRTSMPTETSSPGNFFSPHAQPGARQIVSQNQNRHPPGNDAIDFPKDTSTRSFSYPQHAVNQGNIPAIQNRRAAPAVEPVQPYERSERHEFIPPVQHHFVPRNDRAFVPNQPSFRPPSEFSQRREFSPSHSFDEGPGRFQGNREFGGNFGGRGVEPGRSAAGNPRGGHR